MATRLWGAAGCAAESSTGEVELRLSLREGRTVFEAGEIVRLALGFTARGAKGYSVPVHGETRGMLRGLETYCLEPDGAADPLAEYFALGGMWTRGKGSMRALSGTPVEIGALLNEWRVLEPGRYRLFVVSTRVAGVVARSNVVEFEVRPARVEWQRERLAEAVKDLAGGARTLRFLNTEGACWELARGFYLDQRNGRDFELGLFGTPHRRLAIERLHAEMATGERVLTLEFLRDLVNLQIALEPEGGSGRAAAEYRERRRHGAAWLRTEELLEEVMGWKRGSEEDRLRTMRGMVKSGGFGQELDEAIAKVVGGHLRDR